jgi:MscS family membrane protein
MGSMPPQPRRRHACACAVIIALSLVAAHAPAQQGPTKALAPANTPRDMMRAFLEACRAGDYAAASYYLDLNSVPPSQRRRKGAVLARELKTVLDRTLWVNLEDLSDAPEGDLQDGLPPQRDIVGTIDTPKGPVDILLQRVREPDGKLTWKIAPATVARIPALYSEFGYGELGEYLPPVFFEIHFFELQLWQWIGLLILVGLSAGAAWLLTAVLAGLVRTLARSFRTAAGSRILRTGIGPVRLLIGVLVFAAGTYALALAVPVQAFMVATEKALTLAAVTWLLFRGIKIGAHAIEARLRARAEVLALSLVPLGQRVVQVLVATAAALVALQNFGVNVTGLLAGLGIGGLALALAAQKTVENLFGSVSLIVDQPVRVGDFCQFGDRVGTVEEVGLRSTRIRTLDRTVVTIPNATFSTMQLENFTRRDRIWFHPTIGLRYETTPDQLRYVLVEIKKLLVAHPKVHLDPARSRFVNFGAYSLDIEIFAYILTTDYNEFLAIQEDLLLRIMDIVAASGTGFAFPSQTVYRAPDSGVDREKTGAAEAAVRRWRETNALGLPHFRPEQLAAIADTLDYPPAGAAMRG